MKSKALKLAVLLVTLGFFSSCKMNAQNEKGERQDRQPPSIDKLFEKMDENEDGKLSLAEVKGPLKQHFSKIDTNEDGFLSREELEKAPKPKRRPKQ